MGQSSNNNPRAASRGKQLRASKRNSVSSMRQGVTAHSPGWSATRPMTSANARQAPTSGSMRGAAVNSSSSLRVPYSQFPIGCPDPAFPYASPQHNNIICYNDFSYAIDGTGPCGSWCTRNVSVGGGCGSNANHLCFSPSPGYSHVASWVTILVDTCKKERPHYGMPIGGGGLPIAVREYISKVFQLACSGILSSLVQGLPKLIEMDERDEWMNGK